MIGSDPLARGPRVPSGPLDAALSAYRTLDGRNEQSPGAWFALEATHRGTALVPLSRGARLAVLEGALDDVERALTWTLPLGADAAREGQTRPPLAWLGGSTDGLITILERSILLGWLDGPDISVDGPARALVSGSYDRLLDSPAGALLAARARTERAPDRAAAARIALEEATWLALEEAAADTDAEQRAFEVLHREVAARLPSTEASGSPIDGLLVAANADFTADAGNTLSTAAALVAQAALRLRDRCPDTPCGGLDRIAALRTAARWGGEPWAGLWEVIAAKNALDQLRASFETPFVASAIDRQVELLLPDGGALDRSILRYPTAGPPVRLVLSRALGAGDLTSKDDLLLTVKTRLMARATRALAGAPDRLRPALDRIARRGG